MIFPITGVHTKILVRLRIEERAVGVGDEIPLNPPFANSVRLISCSRGEPNV